MPRDRRSSPEAQERGLTKERVTRNRGNPDLTEENAKAASALTAVAAALPALVSGCLLLRFLSHGRRAGDREGSARRLLAVLPAATLLNGSCLRWLLTCSRTKSTGLSHALQNTTPGECTKLGRAKLLSANDSKEVVGQKNSLEMISPFCL